MSRAVVVKECTVCGKPFEVFLFRVNAGGGKYCSRACRQTGVHKKRLGAADDQDKREDYRDGVRGSGDRPRW